MAQRDATKVAAYSPNHLWQCCCFHQKPTARRACRIRHRRG